MGDRLGWLTGNSSAMGLDSLGMHAPLKGAAVALGTVEPLKKGNKVLNRTRSLKKALEATKRGISKRFDAITPSLTGNSAERKAYRSINRELAQLPDIPPFVEFNRSFF